MGCQRLLQRTEFSIFSIFQFFKSINQSITRNVTMIFTEDLGCFFAALVWKFFRFMDEFFCSRCWLPEDGSRRAGRRPMGPAMRRQKRNAPAPSQKRRLQILCGQVRGQCVAGRLPSRLHGDHLRLLGRGRRAAPRLQQAAVRAGVRPAYRPVLCQAMQPAQGVLVRGLQRSPVGPQMGRHRAPDPRARGRAGCSRVPGPEAAAATQLRDDCKVLEQLGRSHPGSVKHSPYD